MVRMVICSYCNTRYQDTEKCPCRKAANKERNNEKKDYFYTTKKWQKLRKQIVKRDEAVCQRCLIKYNIITTSKLEVHHIKPRSKYEQLQYEPTNLITLCKDCNLELGVREQLDFPFDMEARQSQNTEYCL